MVCSFGGSTANWWERSPNYNNTNNFCNVNTNGNANNNNANNSYGVAPDFTKPSGSVKYSSESELKTVVKGEILPVVNTRN